MQYNYKNNNTYNDYESTIIMGHHKNKHGRKLHQNRLIFQYFQGPLTKFQYIQGLELKLSNCSFFRLCMNPV